MLFAIQNLSASTAFEVEPWNYEVDVPEEATVNKPTFIKYCKNPTTKHCHFSAVEGVDPLRRVNKENPAHQIHGFVVDYDARIEAKQITDLLANSPTEFVPNQGSLTFSHRGRLVWQFETPIVVPNEETHKAFLKIAAKRLKLVALLPGYEEEAFFDPVKYYEKGHDWQQISSDKIPTNMVYQWMYEAGNKVKWVSEEGLTIPMDIIAEEIEKKYSGKWPGLFELGARGPRFWDSTANNDTAAVIRESGIQCFTGNEGFVTWKQLLGVVFIQRFEANRTGEIIAEVFYDGKSYWKLDSLSVWTPISKEDFNLFLKVKHGLSKSPKGETSSEIERVLYAIQDQKSIVSALPFVHFPQGTIMQGGLRHLNISSIRCLRPSDEVSDGWGDKFPWLAEFLDNFFEPEEQLAHFLAWWQYFYGHALLENPQMGQSIFIAGPTGVGKTLLSTRIIAATVGGHADASSYLLGEERFTSHIVSMPIMSVDDTAPATDARRHTKYSAMIKKITANRHQLYEEKYQKAGQVEWRGRVIVTCNPDPESIKLLPNVEISLLDKISLFRCADREAKFPSSNELNKIIDNELPHFCRWLLDWEIPDECKGESRFGVKSYHESHLFNAALQTSASYSFFELLVDFLTDWVSCHPNEDCFTGTATKLVADMSADPRIGSLANKYTPNQVASMLGQLKSRGYKVEPIRNSKQRLWKIPFSILEDLLDETLEQRIDMSEMR